MVARLAAGAEDLHRLMDLRDRAFPGAAGEDDPLDAQSQHLLVEEDATARGVSVDGGGAGGGAGAQPVLACVRLSWHETGISVSKSGYCQQFYDLDPISSCDGLALELGRFALREGPEGWAALRLAWLALTRMVDQRGARRLLGCASFHGADWSRHRAALALLADRHLGPEALRPKRRAAEVVPFADLLAGEAYDHTTALAALPPLLRSYLGMGAWVSDHAVIDRQLDTIHVFTCLEVDTIPESRKAALRAMAAG